MSLEILLHELNSSQKKAATHKGNHTLVLAGAGCGKTKTIIARAAFLISQGIPPERIQILTFTRRAASEIVERVRTYLGEKSFGLRASTFHSWCSLLIRSAPTAFGFKDFSIIDRDDQLHLFKLLRGKKASGSFPTAAQICDLYSFARNTRSSLDKALQKKLMEFYSQKSLLAQIMKDYELKKRSRNYFDYDDILDIVAKGINQYPQICSWVSSHYDHVLVDEMQDTNPLQWELLEPLAKHCELFCVGDDAQSIYGFRGADFKNINSFKDRLPGTTVLKLEDNYRSTQEILDLSNWLLEKSPIKYDKKLRAVRGKGCIPQLHTFSNEFEEGRWIAEDLIKRKESGAEWKEHMILVRSSFSARPIEQALLSKDIPYIFIGGSKLLEAAHVKDLLSVLRIIGNNQDEIAWMRYLTLWPGIGEVTATKIINEVINHNSVFDSIQFLEKDGSKTYKLTELLKTLVEIEGSVSKIIATAVELLTPLLAVNYKNQEWENRERDFKFIEQLAKKHSSILEFIEEYILDPVFNSERDRKLNQDIITIITIHSAKGTERNVCYITNVSVGSYPPAFVLNDFDEVEEERRVLYVALTRAKNELIITRKTYTTWGSVGLRIIPNENNSYLETYYFNSLPGELIVENLHTNITPKITEIFPNEEIKIQFGIDLS